MKKIFLILCVFSLMIFGVNGSVTGKGVGRYICQGLGCND